MKTFCKKMFSKEFIKFVLVGIFNTFNCTLLSTIYAYLFASDIAFVLGYISSLTMSFILNSYFTFRETPSWKKFIPFCIGYVPNFLIQYLCVLLISHVLGWNHIIAYLLAACIGVPVTFLCIKWLAFNHKNERN
jgi:Predicted membrane protein